MRTASGTNSDDFREAPRSGEFIERLSPEARSEFESLRVLFSCPANTVLFMEDQAPSNILFLLAGQVKVSMNSYTGRRLYPRDRQSWRNARTRFCSFRQQI